uniref:Serine/threonine specific protein phosphatases domain-containing protein n=1 Tax=Wuchereria bancrofti TaxID=6293 RepID=A0AAF5PG48_WUCBA
MANYHASSTCKTFDEETLNDVILSIFKKSFRDGISALVWMNREIMITLIHHAIELIDRSDSMFIVVLDEALERKPIFIVGSIDGDLTYLMTLLKQYKMPPTSYFIFLGDYLDCFNPSRIDALLLLLSLKLRFPRNICLFRGHYETYEMCKAIGFDKIIDDERLSQSFFLLFEYLPIIGIFGKFLCLHAGISSFMSDDSFLHAFVKPIEVKRMTVRERTVLTDILYGRPDKNLPTLFAPSNSYPIGNRFNQEALNEVLSIFECRRLIRGCGCRESNGVKFDFDDRKCITVISGCSSKHTSCERSLIQIYQYGQFAMLNIDKDIGWNLRCKHYFKESLEVFIYYCTGLFQSTPYDYQFDLSAKCVACGWIAQGKKPENVTISHTLLKSFVEEMIYPYKLHNHFLLDPRLEQYMHVELFPLCQDFYYHGLEQLTISFPGINEYPFIKAPMIKWNEEMPETASRKSESNYTSYVYINRIIRPGYDLDQNEKQISEEIQHSHRQDLQRLRQLQHWLRTIFAPRLSYKYRIEQLPDENDD